MFHVVPEYGTGAQTPSLRLLQPQLRLSRSNPVIHVFESPEVRDSDCDGRGATAQERHTSAPYLRPLAHPTDMVCTHTHTQTLIPLIIIGSYLVESANCLDWQRGP